MSIAVSFSNGAKRKNSTKQLPMGSAHQCTFKNGCTVLKPTLLLELGDSNFPPYSAFKIGERYYHITNINSLRNNLFEVSGEVDALATYKSQILASTQYVQYSSVLSSAWLPDTRIPVNRNAITSAIVTANLDFPDTAGSYILSVLGQTGVDCFRVSRSGIQAIIEDLQDWQDNLKDDIIDMIDGAEDPAVALAKATTETGFLGNKYSVAVDCIRSCHWVPFNSVVVGGSSAEIYLGSYPTGVTGYKITTSYHSGNIRLSIPWHFSDYRRSTCEQAYLYLPFVGMVALPSDEIVSNASIDIKYSVTASDGQVCYEVQSGGQVIGTYGGNCAMSIPIGINQKASLGDIATTVASGMAKTISAGIDGAVGVATAGLSGNIASVADAGFSLISTTYNSIDTALSTTPTTVGGIGGGAGAGLDLQAKCFTVSHPTVIEPSAMRATMGVPTMKPLHLSSCKGFCKCVNAHVAIPGTSAERDAIDYYLNSGFYIE